MKRLVAALFVLAAFAMSCAHVVPVVKDCGAVTVANLIDDVNTALATGDYEGELAKLIGSFAGCSAEGVVTDAVREVAEKAGLRGQYDEFEATKAKRARAWLADHNNGRMTMTPSVGRIVHYQAYGTPGGEFKSVPRAAVIAAVHDNDECDIVVLNPGGLFFNRSKHAPGDEPTPGCWNWPPRV